MRVPDLNRKERQLGIVALFACAVALLLALLDARAALTGWLAAAVFVQSIPTGGIIFLLTMRLIRGRWQEDLVGVSDLAVALWPLAALAFIPVLIGLAAIYPWMQHPPKSAFAAVWDSPMFFIARTIGWFALLGFVITRALAGKPSELFAAVSLIFVPLYASFAAIDWLMTLDPEFASSGFGLQVLSLECCVALAAMILLRFAMGPPKYTYVLSGLLLTLLLMWAYFQFLPFFITWSGNLPDAARWYLTRDTFGWNTALTVAGLLGGIPLLALLLPQVRASGTWLIWLSLCVLVGKAIEFAWFALPDRGWLGGVAFIVALGGLGGLCFVALAALSRTSVKEAQV